MESPRKDSESVCACCLTAVPQSDRRRERVVLVKQRTHEKITSC